MNDTVHVSLVFSRSGQKLMVRLPRDLAQSADSMSAALLARLIEQSQQMNSATHQDGARAA